MPNAVALPDEVAELTSRLARQGLGAVIDVSDLARALYSSDASLYRVVPRAVARPRTIERGGDDHGGRPGRRPAGDHPRRRHVLCR